MVRLELSAQRLSAGPRPKRLPVWLADRVEADLLDGDQLVDARLPTETALAEGYNVSRQVVREAARLLEDRGLVNVRPGSGMTVAAPSPDGAVQRYESLLRHGRASFAQLMQLRQTIEPEVTALAAMSRAGVDNERMDVSVARAQDLTGDYEAALDADLEFHLLVAEATQNPFVTAFVEPINTALRRLYREPIGYLATQPNTLTEHAAIRDAIRVGDPDAARVAASHHLRRIIDDVAALVKER
jgi:GntR family transcriptional repressor for pyruvate dehydrogenase complex